LGLFRISTTINTKLLVFPGLFAHTMKKTKEGKKPLAVAENITTQPGLQEKPDGTKYSDLYDLAPVGIFTLSDQGKILELNLSGAQMLGKNRSILINDNFWNFIKQESQIGFRIFIKDVFQGTGQISCEVLLSNENENLNLLLEGIISENRETCLVIATDITEQIQVENALRENEERFRLALRATNDVIWDWDIVNDSQKWNEAGTKVFGWTEIVENTVSAKWWVDKVHPDDRQRVDTGFYEVVNNGSADIWHDEYRFRKADGTFADVLDRGYVMRDNKGKAIRMIGAMLDITERRRAERELKDSELLANAIANTTPALLYLYDFNQNQNIWTNEVHKRFFKEINEDISNLQFTDIVQLLHPDDLDSVVAKFGELKNAESISRFNTEVRIKWRNNWKWMRHLVTVFKTDDSGKPIQILGALFDIDEQKKNEKDLQEAKLKAEESEGRFRNLMEGIDSIAVQGYSPDGKTQFWNKASEKLYGYTRQEAIGNNLLDLIIPSEMKDEVSKAIKEMSRSGKPVPSGELILKHKDGSPVPVISSHAVVKITGHLPELFCLDIDISKRKKAEEELRITKDLLNASQRLSKTGGWEWNVEKDTMYWTEETYLIHDLTPGEIEAGSPEHIKLSSGCYQPEDRPLVLSAFQRCLVEGIPYDLEFPFTTFNGRRLWIRTSAEPVIENGKTIRIIGNIIDITDQKKAEIEIIKSKETLDDLNKRLVSARENERAVISREIHDQIGQSLTALKLDMNWLNKHLINVNPEIAAKLSGMIDLVSNSIKDVQRISSDLRPGILDELGLASAIEWYIDEFKNRTGIKCTLKLADSVPDDPPKNLVFFRVLQEAMTNVIRHSNASSVTIRLNHNQSGTSLTIKDNGSGITKEKIESSESLGLIGMRERVRQTGGNVLISSEKGKGTRLIITIPDK